MHTRCTGWEGFCDLYTSNELALRSSLSQINVINNKDLQTAGYFLISLKSLCKNTSSVRVILPTTMSVDVSTKEKKKSESKSYPVLFQQGTIAGFDKILNLLFG